MGKTTGIEWCDHTWNPWMGCTKVSPACDRCYAETLTKNRMGLKLWGHDAPRQVTTDRYWKQPLKWDKEAAEEGRRARCFCGSLCDIMEVRPDLDPVRKRLYELIPQTPNIDWLLLTKRPQEFHKKLPLAWMAQPRPNVVLMTTVESEEYSWRILELMGTPAALRGVSYEPALGPVDWTSWLSPVRLPGRHVRLEGPRNDWIVDADKSHIMWRGLDWVIAGGESGPGARPSHPKWFRDLRDQCAAAQVPFFFKQWGTHLPLSRTDGIHELPFGDYNVETKFGFNPVGKKEAGALLDGREHKEVPAYA